MMDRMFLARIRVAQDRTADSVRVAYGDDVADFVEALLERHLREATVEAEG